ncbi:DUF433 domain-containing protein [bacterium]|nr:DUF433 domain-containing protein [bacterium]
MSLLGYKEVIAINSEIRFGKPCITGTRISVYGILGWLASGMSHEDIIADFPQLTNDHILACLAYSADRERRFKILMIGK